MNYESELQIKDESVRIRLIDIANSEAGSLGAFAEKIGMSDSNFSQYVRGNRKIEGSKLVLRLFNYGINADWILTGHGTPYADNEAGRNLQARQKGDFKQTNKNTAASEKTQNSAHDLKEQELTEKKFRLSDAIAYIKDMFKVPIAQTEFVTEAQLFVRAGKPTSAFDLPSAANSTSIFYIGISGNSMVGMDIHDGDILMMQRQQTFKDRDIILARIGDELTIKQVRNGNGYLLLNPGNPDYEPLKVTPELDFECMGVYTRFKRRD